MHQEIAIISDIHGNSWALSEVLNDISTRNIDLILNLGDSLYGGLDPAGCADILISSDIISVLGNEDLILLEEHVDTKTHQSFDFTKRCLKKEHFNWLRSLQKVKTINNKILMFHGSLKNTQKYLLEDVRSGLPIIRNTNELEKELQNVSEKIILCGHSHLPNIVNVNDKLIINPGSVGLQAYDDDNPVYHKMESGSPHAKYSIIYIEEESVKVENINLEYDWNFAASVAAKNGRNDWVEWIKTGRT